MHKPVLIAFLLAGTMASAAENWHARLKAEIAEADARLSKASTNDIRPMKAGFSPCVEFYHDRSASRTAPTTSPR